MAKAREEFYRGQGVPPGPPTMQGVNGEPDRTGNAYPNAPLGSYDVPKTWPGSPRFAEEIAALLGRRVTPGKSGRPRKLPEPESGDLIMENRGQTTFNSV